MAVYRHGKPVLDIYGGMADVESGKPVTEDTLFVIFSSTKPLAAFCWHILWERGQLEMGDWIGDRWPAFREGGKEDVTVKQILTHTGGFPETPPELTPDKLADWDACVECGGQGSAAVPARRGYCLSLAELWMGCGGDGASGGRAAHQPVPAGGGDGAAGDE